MPVSRTLPLTPPRSRLERGCGDPLVDRLDPETALREAACAAIELDEVGVHALREALLHDERASVRRAAALRLAQLDGVAIPAGPAQLELVQAWLVEALADRFPSVRDAACHALASIGLDTADRPDRHGVSTALRRRMTDDPVWWVRRSAARALALVVDSPAAALDALLPGLGDPFWRVRHAVVQALGLVLAHVDEAQREGLQRALLAKGEQLDHEVARAALVYLAREWPLGEDFPALAGSVGDPAGVELDDPDPAVVTARLLASSERDPSVLVPLLAESHEPLRREAVRRLASARELGGLRPALIWLEDPRVPNAPLALAGLLARLGDRAAPLVEHALASGRPGAIAWAANWLADHVGDDLHAALLDHADHPERRVRAAIVETCGVVLAREPDAASLALVRRAFEDPELDVRDAAASAALVAGQPALAGPHLDRVSPALRARVLARLALDPADPRRLAALRDVDGRVRAAVMTEAGQGSLLDDPDPRVRLAALGPATALAALDDPDPSVRRAAARELSHMPPDPLARARAIALRESDDPWLRARSLDLLDPRVGEALDDEAIATLLLASRDESAMVRAAAADRLAALAPARIEALLVDPRVAVRKAAWTQVAFAADDDASILARIDRGLAEAHEPELIEHLEALAIARGRSGEPRELASRPRRVTHEAAAIEVERRALGRTGVTLSPLVVSGAFGLMPGSLAHAIERGVDTCFWEPRYTTLTHFLRQRSRRGVQVIAGSFHADRAGIVADVELALRRLERDTLDVFLLFWARSPARLGGESLDALRELQALGKIRSFGFSTHDRTIACEAIATGDWPVVMTRHSAAHTGAELELFPRAHAAGVGVLGFSALCYGRMLRGSSVFERGPAALDCYRYALAQPGVSACISAPRRHRELVENLALLDLPALDPTMIEALRAHGREVHADNKRFDRLIRRGGSAPLREAILELFEQAELVEPANEVHEIH